MRDAVSTYGGYVKRRFRRRGPHDMDGRQLRLAGRLQTGDHPIDLEETS